MHVYDSTALISYIAQSGIIAKMEHEAAILAHYILRRSASRRLLARYIKIIQHQQPDISNLNDKKILTFCLKHPWSIGAIDSYLAVFRRHSQFRYRLYVMFAVLESSPECSQDFLPRKRSALYAFYLAAVGLKTILAVVFGFILSILARLG